MRNRAYTTGKDLEMQVKKVFTDAGVLHVNLAKTPLTRNTIACQYPFTDIFGCRARVDFCYMDTLGTKYYIECKQQSVTGSVDQKFPYIIENVKLMDCNYILFLRGDGVRPKVLEWLKGKAESEKFTLMTELSELNSIIRKTTRVVPFLRWIGGKTKILEDIEKCLPDPSTFDIYYEPFIGGGSILFHLLSIGYLENKKVYASDINGCLINCYNHVKNNPKEVYDTVMAMEVSESAYYMARTRFNEIKHTGASLELASLFLYLNKLCFNGIYRENGKGEMNTPYNKKDTLELSLEELSALSASIQDVTFTSSRFQEIAINGRAFIYADPPYHQTFDQYNRAKFDEQQQIELKKFLEPHNFLLSNSNTDFIKELYSEYDVVLVSTKKSVSSKANQRSIEYTEVLVKP